MPESTGRGADGELAITVGRVGCIIPGVGFRACFSSKRRMLN